MNLDDVRNTTRRYKVSRREHTFIPLVQFSGAGKGAFYYSRRSAKAIVNCVLARRVVSKNPNIVSLARMHCRAFRIVARARAHARRLYENYIISGIFQGIHGGKMEWMARSICLVSCTWNVNVTITSGGAKRRANVQDVTKFQYATERKSKLRWSLSTRRR